MGNASAYFQVRNLAGSVKWAHFTLGQVRKGPRAVKSPDLAEIRSRGRTGRRGNREQASGTRLLRHSEMLNSRSARVASQFPKNICIRIETGGPRTRGRPVVDGHRLRLLAPPPCHAFNGVIQGFPLETTAVFVMFASKNGRRDCVKLSSDTSLLNCPSLGRFWRENWP